MHLHELIQRRHSEHQLNAIAPYRWEAHYREGGRLKQFDVDGFHGSLEIDRTRIAALIITGHPTGPIRIEVPADQALQGRIPDDVRIQATTAVAMGPNGQAATVTVWFGYRYGAQWYLLGITDAGRMFLTDRFEVPQ